MEKFKEILWFLLGAVLVYSLFISQAGLVDSRTIDLIDQARQLSYEKDWPGFQPEIYPAEIYKKNLLKKDSIVRYEKNEFYEIKDKPPVYALSMDVDPDGQAVLLLINARDFRSLSDVGNFDSASAEIYYQAVIIHEAFHCFQAEQGFYDVFVEEVNAYEKSNAITLSRKLDEDAEYQKLWLEEMYCLINYAKENSGQNRLAYLAGYQKRLDYLYNKFNQKDVDEYLAYSAFYEKAEGTAKYMENITLARLAGKDLEFAVTSYEKDTAKFYDSGFFKAYILDQKENLDWKTDFFTTNKTFEDYLLGADCL